VTVSTEETPLAIWGSGAAASKARRRQDVVLHTAGPWSRSVMALLKHLEAVGFEGAPRPVGDGFDADGREAITYIPGTTPHPEPAITRLLASLAPWCAGWMTLRSPSGHLRTRAGSLRSPVFCRAAGHPG
jgi:hypothetical protein